MEMSWSADWMASEGLVGVNSVDLRVLFEPLSEQAARRTPETTRLRRKKRDRGNGQERVESTCASGGERHASHVRLEALSDEEAPSRRRLSYGHSVRPPRRRRC